MEDSRIPYLEKELLIITEDESGLLDITAILHDIHDERKVADTKGYGINFTLTGLEARELLQELITWDSKFNGTTRKERRKVTALEDRVRILKQSEAEKTSVINFLKQKIKKMELTLSNKENEIQDIFVDKELLEIKRMSLTSLKNKVSYLENLNFKYIHEIDLMKEKHTKELQSLKNRIVELSQKKYPGSTPITFADTEIGGHPYIAYIDPGTNNLNDNPTQPQ